MYIKQFDTWNVVKKRIQTDSRSLSIRAGEIRWYSCGVNIGSEIDGKGNAFTRPGLIVHVIGTRLALIVPMSTKIKAAAGYTDFEWKGETVSLCIHQMRIVSQKRILSRKGKISTNRLREVKKCISHFYTM